MIGHQNDWFMELTEQRPFFEHPVNTLVGEVKTMQKNRKLSFDTFRGIAIIAVVAIHANTLSGYRGFPFLFYRQLLNFAVPSLIFMSGYWSSKRPIKSLDDYKTFLTKRLSRVLLPYFFWSFLLLGYQAMCGHRINVYELIFKLATGEAGMGYYFVIVISQLYVLTPLLQYINCKPYGLTFVLIFNIIALLAMYLSRLFNFIYPIPASLAFYSWVFFYQIGLWVGTHSDTVAPLKKNVRSLILPIILVCWLISCLETVVISSKYYNWHAVSAVKYSSLLYSACIIFGFLLFEKQLFTRSPRLLALIGQHSFGIYLTHGIILVPVINIFQRIEIIYTLKPLYLLVVVLVTLSICFALIRIARKLLPTSFCNRFLGF